MRDLNRRALLAGLALTTVGAACGNQDGGDESGGAGGPPPSPGVRVGFSPGSSILWASDADVARTLDAIVDTGATMARLDFVWSFAEPARGQFDWRPIDRVVDAAHERDLEILAILNNSPKWAAADALAHTGRPANPLTYGQFARAIASRYLGRVRHYEIWNEPNSTLSFAPAADAGVYTGLLKAAYGEIKAVDSTATVIAGALGPVDAGPGRIPAPVFLERMYRFGAQGYFDALSFHPYDFTAPLAEGSRYPNSPMQQLVSMRRLMVRSGDAAKKIWITEYGAPVSEVGAAKQASLVRDSLQAWPEVDYAGPFFIHTVRDGPDPAEPEDTYGAVTVDYTRRPMFEEVRRWIADGKPMRSESEMFAQRGTASLGEAVTPVFHLGDGLALQFEHGMMYRNARGYFTSPAEVGALARAMNLSPTTHFTRGYQDFAASAGLRIFSKPSTGTHVVQGDILGAWRPDLGFPTSGEYPPVPGQLAVNFERGRITWSPATGTTIEHTR